MWTLFLKLCEYVFPRRESYIIVQDLKVEDLLLHALPTTRNNIISLLPFNEPLVRAVIHEAKFKHNERAWELLGTVLFRYLKHFEKEVILIPIPLSEKRRSDRKYNQVEEIAKCAQKLLPSLRISIETLYRKRNTVPQTSLSRKQRLTNVADAFGVRNTSALQNKNIIILDDVSTTGATLHSAHLCLQTHSPASITLVSLAR